MSQPNPSAVAEAISIYVSRPDDWEDELAHSDVLLQSARAMVFDLAAIAPMESLVRVSLVQTAAVQTPQMSQPDLLSAWEGALQDSCESYARAPEGWQDHAVADFEASLSRCFGVDSEMVHDLIRVFHQMKEGARFGVLLAIEKSTVFKWMSIEIDSFSRAVELVAPPLAMRRLLSSVFNGQ